MISDAVKHARHLNHALDIGHPVLYQGKTEYLDSVIRRGDGGGVETTVYLRGRPGELIPADEVSIKELPT